MLVAFRRQPARRTAVVFGLGGLAKGRVRGHYKPSIGKFIPTYTTKRPEAMQAAGQLSMFGDTGQVTEAPAHSAAAWSEPASTYIGSYTSSAKIGDWQVYVTRPRFEEQFVFVAGRHQKPGSPKRRESGGGYATIEEARAAAVAATQTPDPERVPDTPEVAEYRAATKNLSPDTSNPRGARVFEAMKTLRPAVHAGDMDEARRMAQAALPVVQEAYEWAAGSEWANPKAQKSTVALYGRPLKYLEKLTEGASSAVSKAVNPVAAYTRRGKSGQIVQVGGYTRNRRPGKGGQHQSPAQAQGPRVTMKPAKHASTSAEDLQKRYGKPVADHHAYIGDRPVMLRQHGAGGKRGYAVYDGDGKLMATAHVQALPDGQGAALTATWTAPEAYGQQAHSPLLRRLVGEYGKVYSPHAVHADLWATVQRMGGDQGGGEFEAADEGSRKRLQRKAQAGLFDDEAVGKSLGRRFVAFFKGVVKGYYKPSIGKWVPQYTTRRTKKPEEVGQQRMFAEQEETAAPRQRKQAEPTATPPERSRDDVIDVLAAQHFNAGKSREKLERWVPSQTFRIVRVPVAILATATPVEPGAKARTEGPLIVDRNDMEVGRHQGAFGAAPTTLVIDGKHRLAEAKARGDKEIDVYVGDKAVELLQQAVKEHGEQRKPLVENVEAFLTAETPGMYLGYLRRNLPEAAVERIREMRRNGEKLDGEEALQRAMGEPEAAQAEAQAGLFDSEDESMAKSVLKWVAVFGDVAKSLRLLKGRVKAHYKPSIGKWVPSYTTKRPEAMQQAGQLSMFGEEDEGQEELEAQAAVPEAPAPEAAPKPKPKPASDFTVKKLGQDSKGIYAATITHNETGASQMVFGRWPRQLGAAIGKAKRQLSDAIVKERQRREGEERRKAEAVAARAKEQAPQQALALEPPAESAKDRRLQRNKENGIVPGAKVTFDEVNGSQYTVKVYAIDDDGRVLFLKRRELPEGGYGEPRLVQEASGAKVKRVEAGPDRAEAPTTDAPQAGAEEAPAKPRQFRGEECDEYTETIQKLAATAHNQMMGEVDSGKVNGTEVPEARLAELAGRGQGYRAVGDIFERIVSDIVDESDEGGWEGTAILSPDQVADAIERINAAAASIEHNADGSDATAYKQMVLRSGAAAIRDAADKLRQIATTGATPPAAPKGTLGDPDDDGPTVGDEFADDDDDGGWKPASMQEHFVAAHKAGRMDLWEKLAEAHVALRRAHEADRIYENDPEHSEGRKFEQARVDALKAAIKELGLKRPSGPKEVPASRIARAKIAHEKAQKRLDDAKRLDAGLFVKPDSPRYTEAAEENLRKRKQMHERLAARASKSLRAASSPRRFLVAFRTNRKGAA